MRLFVTVKTRAREERVEQLDETHFRILVRAMPVDSRANDAVRRVLALFLRVPLANLTLRAGMTGKRKVFEVSRENDRGNVVQYKK